MKTQKVSRLRAQCVGALFCAVILAQGAAAQVTTVAALVNAVNNGAANSTVTVGPGTFLLTAPLQPKAGMTITGAGSGQTILRNAASWQPSTVKLPEGGVTASAIETGAYLFSVASNTNGITISNMTLTGPELHGAYYGYSTDNLHLHDLIIKDFRWSGIRTFEMDGANIHDCEFIDAGGRWENGSPGVSGGITGGGMYMTWMKTSQIWNNRFSRTKTGDQFNFYGIKGREGRTSRIHHNTINVNFSIEFPFENDHTVEIDHNICKGVISIPKYAGGPVPAGGYTFHIHDNYFTTSYAIEFVRNGVEIDHNLFDFTTASDGGNLISGFGSAAAPGPASFHNNLVKNPGRGVYWVNEVFNNIEFRNNHVIANTTATPRLDGLFGFNSACDFSTITIKDNIIECIGQTRPLVRNTASNSALISNNTLINVSGTGNYSNPNTGAVRGLTAPLLFTCGVNSELTVNGWNSYPTDDWTSQDIGSTSPAGSATYGSGTFTLKGAGADIWGSSDAFHFLHQVMTGDGTITARVNSVQNTNGWAKAGVMVRESLTPGSKHATTVVTPLNGVSFQWRVATNGTSTSATTGGITAPRWVRMVRQGNTFTSYQSANGTSWTQLGTPLTMTMNSQVYVGLAVTSHNNGTLCEAVFSDVSRTTP